MNEKDVSRKNYDVASITRKGAKRKNYVQDALSIDPSKIKTVGKFIRVFSDMFLKREVGPKAKAYF